MPELPEVETLRQDLAREVLGRKIKTVAVANGRSVRRHASAKHFRTLLEGRTIKSVGRLGKYLLLTLDSGDTLVVHLGMSGQLLRVKSVKDPKPKHTHVVITFTQGGELRYVDPADLRRAVRLHAAAQGRRHGPEPGRRARRAVTAPPSARPSPSWPTWASTPSRTR